MWTLLAEKCWCRGSYALCPRVGPRQTPRPQLELMNKRGGSSGRALQSVPVARERRQRTIFAQPMPQLGPRRQQIQHVADQIGRGLVASDQKQDAEPQAVRLARVVVRPRDRATPHTPLRGRQPAVRLELGTIRQDHRLPRNQRRSVAPGGIHRIRILPSGWTVEVSTIRGSRVLILSPMPTIGRR